MRISKYLSLCGVTSRRGAEALIGERKVILNGHIVEIVGTVIDEITDVVKVNGTVVEPVSNKVYIVLNKPAQVMTTLHDPFKRRTVVHCLKRIKERVYPVGRLDYDTSGVLLLTNDGDFAYRLAHPKYGIKKIYEAKVSGRFSNEASKRIAAGIKLEDGAIGKAEAKALSYGKDYSRVRLVLTEGRKREVKQLCKAVGHPVKHLVRVSFAGITAKGLKPGAWRHLTDSEVKLLHGMLGLEA